MLIVEKFPWANTLDVTQRRRGRRSKQLGPALPEHRHRLRRSSGRRPSSRIAIEQPDRRAHARLPAGGPRARRCSCSNGGRALISLVAIPLSLMAAGLVLYVRGATINTMVLAGFVIAVGVVVDDAIIDIENIVRRLRQHRREGRSRSTASVILEASLEVRSAIVYATLIDVVAIIPVFFMEGLSGRVLPAAGLLVRAGRARLDGRRPDRHAGAGLILLRNAPLERARIAARALAAARLRELSRADHRARPRSAYADGRRRRARRRRSSCRGLGQSLLPDVQGTRLPDALADRRRAPRSRRWTASRRRPARSCAHIPGVRNFGAHIGQALACRRSRRHVLRRELDQRRSGGRLR